MPLANTTRLLLARVPHVFVAVVLFCACGCDEPRKVAWLPDSSGFVYADKNGTRLMQYDVGKKARRVISEQAKRVGYAVSPDGKHVAATQCEVTATAGSRKQTSKIVVAVVDREGRQQARSKALEIEDDLENPAVKSETSDAEIPVCWDGHPDRLLTPFGMYDRKADRWIKLPALPVVFVVPGCPPTAKGFLAIYATAANKPGVPERKGEWKVCFVDWDGWASDFKEPVKEYASGEMVTGGWDDKTWRLVTTGGVHSFDTVGLKHEFTKGPDKAWEALGRPGRYHRFAGVDLALTVFDRKVKPDGSELTYRLELHSPGKQRRKVVHAEGEYTGFELYPSPNGKLVAVRCFHPGETEVFDKEKMAFVPRVPPLPPKNVIAVFDDTGEVVATVKPE